MKTTYHKLFEISFPKAVYFGSYHFDGNELWIDDVHTFDEDGNKIEIDSFNDKEIFDRIYKAVEDDKSDEIQEEREDFIASNTKSKLSDF